MYEPIVFKDNKILILDQRLIPWKKVYRRCRNYKDVAYCIKEMVVRGAPAIGVTAAYGMALAAISNNKIRNTKQYLQYLKQVGNYLVATRPTAVNLAWAVNRMLTVADQNSDKDIPELKAILLEESQRIFIENKVMDEMIDKYGATLFAKGRKKRVLTHCNTGPLATAGYGTALGVLIEAYRQGFVEKVFVDETRPYLQGARLTVWELMQAKVPCVLICDNMAGYFMQQGEIDAAIVGADRIAANGDTANKIGTYSVSVLAKENKIPFYVAAPSSSIDLSISSGKKIKIEYRSAEEVRKIRGKLITVENVPVINPSFDITPGKNITAIITENGIIRKPYKKNLNRILK